MRAWHSGGCAGSTRSLGFTRLEVACRLRRNAPRRRPWHGEREPEAPEPRGCLAASHPATPPTPRLSDRAHHPESTEGARSLALETVRFWGFSATGRERATERNFANWGAGAAPDPSRLETRGGWRWRLRHTASASAPGARESAPREKPAAPSRALTRAAHPEIPGGTRAIKPHRRTAQRRIDC